MTNRFLISVAALALFAGTGFANAQGTMGRDSGAAGGQQMQQSQQPSGAVERGGAMNKSEGKSDRGTVGQAGGSSTMKSGQSAEEHPSGSMKKNEAAEDKAGASKGMRSDERVQGQEDRSKGMKAESRDKNMKAEDGKSGTSTSNAQNRTGTSTSTSTTGQAGAGAKLSTEQRTQITSVIHEERVAPVTNVNFSISVGTRVPREGIEFHALPSRVVTIYPEWRSYKYLLVRDEIVIIDPATYEIVAVLNG
jgi:hypothetical protein